MGDRDGERSARVYVGGLTESVKKEDLESEFEKYGKLNSVWVAFNPPGFAFIEFNNLADAETACDNLNGTDFLGSKLRVEIARGKSRRGGSGGGFRGGRGRGGPPFRGYGGGPDRSYRGGGSRGGRSRYDGGSSSGGGGYGRRNDRGGSRYGGRDFNRRSDGFGGRSSSGGGGGGGRGGGRRFDGNSRFRSRSPNSGASRH